MQVRITDREVWRPKFNGNLDLPDEDQIRITIKHPTTAAYGHMQEMIPTFDESGKSSVKVQSNPDTVIRRSVKKIENLETVNEEGQVVKITNGQQLLDAAGLSELKEQISARIMERQRIEEDDLKNS